MSTRVLPLRGSPRRRRGIAAVVGLSLVALAACSGAGGDDDGGPAQIQIALPTGVTSFANADVVVADELGYFEDAGIEVEIMNLRSGTSVANGVVGGEFEVGGASIEPVVNAFAGGAEISIFASYADRLEVELVVPEDVQSVEDLAGRDLGIQEVGAFREAMTRMVLEDAGMTPNDVNYVSVSSDAYVSGLVQGQITSAVLHPEQGFQAAAEDPSLHPLVNLYEIEPDYFNGAYFADNAWLEDNPDAARGFAQALTRAHRTMYAERDLVVPIIAEVTSMEESVIDDAWEVYMQDVQAFPRNVGLEEDRLEYTLERMQQMETLAPGAEVDLAELIDRGPMEAAVEELGEAEQRE